MLTKQAEIELLRRFVAELPAGTYLADIIGSAAIEIENMIRNDVAWPIGETIHTIAAERRNELEHLAALRQQLERERQELRDVERKQARARVELEEIRSTARRLLSVA